MRKKLPTGLIDINVAENKSGLKLDKVFDVAARQNPKRGFLIVSKLIGRHVPTRPKVMRDIMDRLADQISDKLEGPVLFIGMAETAVGLGQGVHDAWTRKTGRKDAYFLQTTRQTHELLDIWFQVEEGHSHATTHLVHKPKDYDKIVLAKTLIIIDDECSTGKTFEQVEQEARKKLPYLTRVINVCITDWSPENNRECVSLVKGNISWQPSEYQQDIPGKNANGHGRTSPFASMARIGYSDVPEIDFYDVPVFKPGTRVTVVADGENSFNALRVAEYLEGKGCVAALQSITRSPAHICDVLKTRAILTDSYGSGAMCYSYNLKMHVPDHIVVVSENNGLQCQEISQQANIPMEYVHLVEIRT